MKIESVLNEGGGDEDARSDAHHPGAGDTFAYKHSQASTPTPMPTPSPLDTANSTSSNVHPFSHKRKFEDKNMKVNLFTSQRRPRPPPSAAPPYMSSHVRGMDNTANIHQELLQFVSSIDDKEVITEADRLCYAKLEAMKLINELRRQDVISEKQFIDKQRQFVNSFQF